MDERTLERLNAYLDGELDRAQAAADAQCLLDSHPAARDAFEVLKSQRSALDRAWPVAAREGRASTWAAPATDGSKHATPRVPWTLLVPIAAAALLGFVAGSAAVPRAVVARIAVCSRDDRDRTARGPRARRDHVRSDRFASADRTRRDAADRGRQGHGRTRARLGLRLAPHTTLTIDDARTCSLDRGAVLSDVAPSDNYFRRALRWTRRDRARHELRGRTCGRQRRRRGRQARHARSRPQRSRPRRQHRSRCRIWRARTRWLARRTDAAPRPRDPDQLGPRAAWCSKAIAATNSARASTKCWRCSDARRWRICTSTRCVRSATTACCP